MAWAAEASVEEFSGLIRCCRGGAAAGQGCRVGVQAAHSHCVVLGLGISYGKVA